MGELARYYFQENIEKLDGDILALGLPEPDRRNRDSHGSQFPIKNTPDAKEESLKECEL